MATLHVGVAKLKLFTRASTRVVWCGAGGGTVCVMAVVSEEARIRELAELIRSRCAVAQQMRQAVHSNTTSIQVRTRHYSERCVHQCSVCVHVDGSS